MERIFVWNHQDEKKKLAAQEVRKRHRANKKSNKPATPETWQEVLLRQTDLPPWKRNLRVFLLEAVEDAQAAISLFKQLSPAKLFKLPDIHKKLPYDTPETRGRRTPLHPPMRAMAAAEARNNGNLEAGVELTNRDVFKRPKQVTHVGKHVVAQAVAVNAIVLYLMIQA
ncbi:unnamed protein product [Pedinophyceae sp. YPF-701]|nr:unnamed protein product [Pedinophyceae sp. YPF-701]